MTTDYVPKVVVFMREPGKAGLFRFTCDICGRRSGGFSLKESATKQAQSHVKDRCPGAPT